MRTPAWAPPASITTTPRCPKPSAPPTSATSSSPVAKPPTGAPISRTSCSPSRKATAPGPTRTASGWNRTRSSSPPTPSSPSSTSTTRSLKEGGHSCPPFKERQFSELPVGSTAPYSAHMSYDLYFWREQPGANIDADQLFNELDDAVE